MMNDDFLISYKQQLINDEPIEIIKGLKIYPVSLRDYIMYSACSQVMQIDKNSINDPRIISMSYLEFLIFMIQEDIKSNVYGTATMLYTLISIVIKIDKPDITYAEDEKGKLFISIEGVRLYKKDFDIFRKTILYQNSPSYKEEYINPELKADIEKAKELRSRGHKPKDIEYQIMAVVLGTGMSYEQVLDMTIRRFYIASELIESKMAYQMQMQASMSGFVQFKGEIPHYLSESNNGIENDVVDYAQFKDKISNA